MAKKVEEFRVAPAQIFECEAIPSPPGTKARARLPRGLEPEPSYRRWWVTAIVAALGVGMLVGRFLLP